MTNRRYGRIRVRYSGRRFQSDHEGDQELDPLPYLSRARDVRAARPRPDRRLRRRRRIERRRPADGPRRDLQQRRARLQRRPLALPRRLGRGRPGGQLRGQPERPVPGRPRRSGGDPAARLDGLDHGRGRRSELQLRGRAHGHRRQRLRRVRRQRLRGRYGDLRPVQGARRAGGRAAERDRGALVQRGVHPGVRAVAPGPGRRPGGLRDRLPGLAGRPDQRGRPRRSRAPRPSTSAAASTSTPCSTTWSSSAARSRRPRPPAYRPRSRCSRSPTRSTRRASTSTPASTTTSCAVSTSTSSLDPSSIPEASASGVESVDANFSMRLAGVNEDQDDRRAERRAADRGAAGPVRGRSERARRPRRPGGAGGTIPGVGGGAGGGGGGGGNADAYLDCIAEAQTPDEINACANDL